MLRKRYRSLHFRFEHYTHNDVVTAFLNAFTGAYDPHSSYLSPDDLENFNISMRLSLEGIGATLRWEDGYTVISSIIPGGAAAREGTLQPEDKIIAVAEGDGGT
ncbi:MAG: tail-specific protease, partial [Gammaproteobacteria bacterium]|nr:tail-specific protease [Gammaproteobacteria bacterium]NIR98991.1 tail-specific protease [Gammaproteobacteria bacterium]NIT62409.1 tail-specific protease [Gammaproteobacteria bacterium]NIV19341.1 tail-specific protease [Gammaproteobacteria bacterium]NIX10270.1 tail-specific protease [Gammaproteobacteria bacterium]